MTLRRGLRACAGAARCPLTRARTGRASPGLPVTPSCEPSQVNRSLISSAGREPSGQGVKESVEPMLNLLKLALEIVEELGSRRRPGGPRRFVDELDLQRRKKEEVGPNRQRMLRLRRRAKSPPVPDGQPSRPHQPRHALATRPVTALDQFGVNARAAVAPAATAWYWTRWRWPTAASRCREADPGGWTRAVR